MKVTIWDMDYYYNPNKKNAFNPDAMKIASYHKQLGDSINFVLKQDDINRPFDLYYIIKEKEKTPNPPAYLYLEKNVRWWGKAFKMRINGKMSDAMLGCRPDYLLYPEKETTNERAEQLRLFNNKGKPLKWIQDGSNTFKRKKILVTDTAMWYAAPEDILEALHKLQELPKVAFLEPIGIQKLLAYPELREAFMKLHFLPGTNLTGSPVSLEQGPDARDFLMDLRYSINTHVYVGALPIDYRHKDKTHGTDPQIALDDFSALRQLVIEAKNLGIHIELRMPTTRLETPYFEVFEALSLGTKYYFQLSGLEFLTTFYGKINRINYEYYGNNPNLGNEVFRDLLRQTYQFKDFLLLRGNNKSGSINDIPWQMGEDEFKYGL